MGKTNSFDRFSSRGRVRNEEGEFGGVGERVVNDNRKPIYLVFILDTSGSMTGTSTIINEMGDNITIPKIEQLNQGVKKVINSLQDFEENNPLYRLYLQIIELNSYGKAVFQEFQPVSKGFEEIMFQANGCTELRASLNTLKTFISDKYLRDDRPGREGKGYNKAVSVILMSDGWPTDSNGVEQSGPVYKNVINEFNNYLVEQDYYRNVDKYSIAVGDDACEDMLKYFCDGGEDLGDQTRFYRVDKCESIANALDYLTRATLAHHTTLPITVNEDNLLGSADNGNYLPEQQDDNKDDIPVINPDDYNIINNGNGTDPEPNVYEIDVIKCKKDRCKRCLQDICPQNAIVEIGGIISIDTEVCNGCGICEAECPYSAISIAEKDQMLDTLFNGLE